MEGGGGWNDATLYRWRGGFALDRANGRKDKAREMKRDEGDERKQERSRDSERGEREGDHSHLEV